MIRPVLLFLIPALFLFFACGSSAKSGVEADARAGRMPAWVNSIDSEYPRTQYVAATGFASSRAMAEENALAALASFFGQSIQVERNAISAYRQAVVNGVTDGWIDTVEMNSVIKTSALMENLLGAEIKEVWFDSRDTYYAAAVMEKARSARIYNELLRANLNIIKNLVTMTSAEKNTLNGVIRYRFAAVIADINVPYGNIVRLLDALPPDGITGGNYYRLEAQNIIRAIPVSITVTGDRRDRIFGAFAKCFTDLGFETNAGGSRYVLNVSVTMSPVDLPSNPNYFTRIELAANLADKNLGLVLLPWNLNSREGHVTQAEAENRAVAAAERSINDEFGSLLSDYLSQLIPR